MRCALTFSEAEEIRRMQSFEPNVGRLARNRHLQNLRERSVVWRKEAGIASLFAMLAAFSPHFARAQVLNGTSVMSSECVDSIQKAMAYVSTGRLVEAEVELTNAFARASGSPDYKCI